ncbi:MAG TPA: hypothetical protein VM901_02215 [Bdellovibrionota bacterium]|jgi:hypothetical protein|nr:hypothetical protein [Bdellovibrionota bacterium]
MGKFRKCFVSFVALCISLPALGAEKIAPEWSAMRVPHREISVRVIFPTRMGERRAAEIFRFVQESLARVEARNQGHFEESFEILLDPRPAFHNGLATVLPRNFIWVHTVPPQNNSSIGFSNEYLSSTLTHEMAHMYYLQKRRGLFRAGAWVFGNLSTPLGAWPRWMHEGWATWVEQRFATDDNAPYLNFLKRTYADYVLEHPGYRLTNSLLEGSASLHQTEAGEIPYAFGYSMLDKIFAQIKPEDWAQHSSSSLGISFRSSARSSGFSMDEIFARTETEWRSEKPNVRHPAAVEVHAAPTITSLSGALALENDEGEVSVRRLAGHRAGLKISWPHFHWHLAHLVEVPSRKNTFVAAFYSAPRTGTAGTRLRVGVFQVESETYPSLVHKCTLVERDDDFVVALSATSAESIEVRLSPRLISDATSTLEESLALHPDCGAGASSAPGLTLSTRPYDTQTWYLQRGSESWSLSGLVSPRLERPETCRQVFGFATEICLGGIHNTGAFRDPVIIARHAQKLTWHYKKMATRTGAQALSFSESDAYWVEKYWDEDRIFALPLATLAGESSVPWTGVRSVSDIATPAPASAETPAIESYSTLSTLWPHYWMPRLYATQGGVIVSGTTWFHDITKTYEGSVDLGYDTFSRAPYAQAGLQRKIGDLVFPQSVDASAAYLRDISLGVPIDQGVVQAGVSATLPLSSSLNVTPRLSIAGKWHRIDDLRKSFLVPGLSTSWQYRDATDPGDLNVDQSEHRFGVFAYARTAWIRRGEVYAEAALTHEWPLSWALHLEYGQTSQKNLPYSYFEWGGAYALSLAQPAFVSRGFAPRMAATTQVGRAALVTGWRWTDRLGGLGWSRFDIEKLTQDLFVESVSFDRIRPGGMQIGRDYFTSVGTEMNFWIRTLFYLRSRAFVGLYRGLGDYGETRVGVGFASNLDI